MANGGGARDPAEFRAEWPEHGVLARVGESVLDGWLRAGEVKIFGSGERLIEEGADESDVFLLLAGCVKVVARLGNGGEALLAVRVGGDLVGELAAFDGERRSATVVACGNDSVVTCRIAAREFLDVLSQDHAAGRTVTRSITAKLRASTRRRVDLPEAVDVRLANVLVELVEDHGHRLSEHGYVIKVDLTQLELGTLVGASKRTAQRALRKLRNSGLVEPEGRRIVVRDLAALRAISRRSGSA
ncbi:cAMP-binding domain of CRP or a regulatory subunit of cAMP-dependent protein kinases [Amycolatopsis tolypomycina]|uniref:cAMP-binding domain of CRP or a regulatory subunit of cAMP-dependent protein kinases n=1 Tax=Amycolatopsis tolypomycina TaxID=208445 RepID=A0A1H4ZMJ1_9PSEU|nr:Crp/Fnr family transcriptional regulator [Amycolatopsis tolypomycina]SED31342.1 cAMP-binding domain of CRP or a regulatory subunit of cAMP-dependent protein kinases [Amycolatopsis tolypomycina]